MTSMMDVDEGKSSPLDYTTSMDLYVDTPSPPDLQKWQDELYGDFSDDLADTSQASIPKYDFRPAARIANRFITITWIDQDENGTYDLDGRRGPSPIPFNRKRRERPEQADDGRPKRPKTNTSQHDRSNSCQMIVTFKISSEHGLAWPRAAGITRDNWPPVGQRHSSWSSSGDESSSENILNGITPYSLRERTRCGLSDSARFNGCELPDLADITLGHPAARGCKGCFAKGEDCPLHEEGSRYPCTFCQEDEKDCDLITEPLVKRACEPCGRRRAVCSYRELGSDHTKPCIPCLTVGVNCVVGPLSGRTRVGPSIDQARPGRKKGCSQCLRARKWCSLKNKKPTLPCNLCRKNGQECSFEPVRREFAISETKPKRKVAASRKSQAALRSEGKQLMTIAT
ncbi:hypothetical protein N7G274_010059 [Stereocaulon virgatum]|uniref:Zn(2)-C6 fungal-type domain-containing protein n=1 Tax=Stereocaulon virgatum TaxID=373712 RepID=A0ABR3ZW94_9LECA